MIKNPSPMLQNRLIMEAITTKFVHDISLEKQNGQSEELNRRAETEKNNG